MKVLIINGPNLNLLGIREKEIYGDRNYKELCSFIKKIAKENKINASIFQSNYEGKIVEKIQKSLKKIDYLIINAGAYSLTVFKSLTFNAISSEKINMFTAGAAVLGCSAEGSDCGSNLMVRAFSIAFKHSCGFNI